MGAKNYSVWFNEYPTDLLFLPFPVESLLPVVDSKTMKAITNDPHLVGFDMLEHIVHLKLKHSLFSYLYSGLMELYKFLFSWLEARDFRFIFGS